MLKIEVTAIWFKWQDTNQSKWLLEFLLQSRWASVCQENHQKSLWPSTMKWKQRSSRGYTTWTLLWRAQWDHICRLQLCNRSKVTLGLWTKTELPLPPTSLSKFTHAFFLFATPKRKKLQKAVLVFFGIVNLVTFLIIHSGFCRALGSEMTPLLDRARTAALGRYESCLRPQIGELTSDIIDTIKIYLDLFLPA